AALARHQVRDHAYRNTASRETDRATQPDERCRRAHGSDSQGNSGLRKITSHASALTSHAPKSAPTLVIGQVVYDPIARSPSAGMRNLTAVTTSIPSGTGRANPGSELRARNWAGLRFPGERRSGR